MINRRDVLFGAVVAGLPARARGDAGRQQAILRRIPSSGEMLPVIGMGTSRTFDVGEEAASRAPLAAVLAEFLNGGGRLIDSSPMYGRAEQVTGDLLREAGAAGSVFAATKVWADGREEGKEQMSRSMQRMGVERMDLMQVHNLRDWRSQLVTLREWKEAGRIRYIGITTSFAKQYDEFKAVMRAERLDFVQLNYSVGEPESAGSLLPLARDRGMAVMVNRPFMRAELFRRVSGKPLPAWAAEIGCSTWAQVFLKWILAHPAVTCVIPASARAANMRDNMQAGFGELPDAALRRRIAVAVSG